MQSTMIFPGTRSFCLTSTAVTGLSQPSCPRWMLVLISLALLSAASLVSAQSPPVFTPNNYVFALNEGQSGISIMLVLGTVLAIDPDGDSVSYSISDGDTSLFSIDTNAGIVSYIGQGEGETPGRYELLVSADTAFATVTISVIINEPPVFSINSYTFPLDPNMGDSDSTADIPVGTVLAIDPDGDSVNYLVIVDNSNGKFTIGTTSGVVSYIGSGETTGSYVLVVSASDGSSFSITLVTINVNSGPLLFNPDSYSFRLEANTDGSGSAIPVGTVSATDSDGNPVMYSFSFDNSGNRFSIDPSSGAISYIGSGETTGSYVLIVIARVGSQTTAAAITITVESVSVGMPTQVTAMALAHIGRNIAINTIDVIGGRFTAVPHAKVSGHSLGFNSLRLNSPRFNHWLRQEGAAAWNGMEREIDFAAEGQKLRANLLTGSSFLLPLDAIDDGSGDLDNWSVWGQGKASGFTHKKDGASAKGSLLSGYLGVDYKAGYRLLFGIAVARSNANSDVQNATDNTRTDVDTTITTLYPYLHWSPGEGFELWGVLGHGIGKAEIRSTSLGTRGVKTDINQLTAAAGLKKTLGTFGHTAVSLKADGFVVRVKSDRVINLLDKTNTGSSFFRILLSGRRNWLMAGNAQASADVELGARVDSGDAVTGLGLDLGGSLGYEDQDAGVAVTTRGRLLVAHSDNYHDWGLGLTIHLQPGEFRRGLSLALSPTWGQPSDQSNTLWDNGAAVLKQTTNSDSSGWIPASTWLSLRYGLSYRSGLLTPFAELGMTRNRLGHLRTGLRLEANQPVADLYLDLFGERSQPSGKVLDQRIAIEAVIGF